MSEGMAEYNGSDSVKTEMFCEVCRNKTSKHRTAEGFCSVCIKYMCGDCLIFHQEFHPTHGHQDEDHMPADFCLDTCTDHSSEIVKHYCDRCDRLFCDICIKSHNNCNSAHHLPQYVKNLENRSEYLEFSEKLCNMETSVAAIEKVIDSDNKTINDCSKYAIKAVEKVQMEVNRRFEILKEEIDEKLAPMKEKDQHKVQSITQHTDNVKHTMNSLKAGIDKEVADRNRCKLFIKMHSAKEDVKNMEKRLTEINENCLTPIHRYHFELSQQIQSLLSSDSVLGTILLDSETKRTAEHEQNLTVQHSKTPLFGRLVDTLRPQGMCFLQSKFLIVIGDFDSCLLKVIDIETNSIVAQLRRKTLQYVPQGITKTGINQIAFTIPDNGLIHLCSITASGEISSLSNIAVGKGCHGIVHTGKSFIVSYIFPQPVIKVLNMNGETLKKFPTNKTATDVFKLPYSLGISPDRNTLYVADRGLNIISSLNMKGEIIQTYRADNLNTPNSLTVDAAGSVYVCGTKSQNIVQLSENLTKVKVLLRQNNQLTDYLCVHSAEGKLYVGKENLAHIEVYKTEPE